jgi:hypothetical protein
VLLGLLEKRHRTEDASAVDEHVDASKAVERRIDEALGLGR